MFWIKCKRNKINWKGLKVEAGRVATSFFRVPEIRHAGSPVQWFLCWARLKLHQWAWLSSQERREKFPVSFFGFCFCTQRLWSGSLLLRGFLFPGPTTSSLAPIPSCLVCLCLWLCAAVSDWAGTSQRHELCDLAPDEGCASCSAWHTK